MRDGWKRVESAVTTVTRSTYTTTDERIYVDTDHDTCIHWSGLFQSCWRIFMLGYIGARVYVWLSEGPVTLWKRVESAVTPTGPTLLMERVEVQVGFPLVATNEETCKFNMLNYDCHDSQNQRNAGFS